MVRRAITTQSYCYSSFATALHALSYYRRIISPLHGSTSTGVVLERERRIYAVSSA